MCEFCNLPNKGGPDRDTLHSDFAGFFSADAIDAAVKQANASRTSTTTEKSDDGDEDDDGT